MKEACSGNEQVAELRQEECVHRRTWLLVPKLPSQHHGSGSYSWIFQCGSGEVIDSRICCLLVQLILSPNQHLQQARELWI